MGTHESDPQLIFMIIVYPFSFKDNDKSTSHCAQESASGWWFNDCSGVNLNGVYHGARSRATLICYTSTYRIYYMYVVTRLDNKPHERLEKDKFDVKTGERLNPEALDGVYWNSADQKWSSLRMTKMFIAPKSFKEYPCLYQT